MINITVINFASDSAIAKFDQRGHHRCLQLNVYTLIHHRTPNTNRFHPRLSAIYLHAFNMPTGGLAEGSMQANSNIRTILFTSLKDGILHACHYMV